MSLQLLPTRSVLSQFQALKIKCLSRGTPVHQTDIASLCGENSAQKPSKKGELRVEGRHFPAGPVVKNPHCNMRDRVTISGWGTKILSATTAEPKHSGACAAQLESPHTTREPTRHNSRAHTPRLESPQPQLESPHTTTRESTATTREPTHHN